MRTKLSYYKVFTENLLAVEVRKTEILMNKAVCLELSILELLCIIWYHYANQNCVSENNYKNIAEDVKTRFDTSNYESDILFPKRKKSNWVNKR